MVIRPNEQQPRLTKCKVSDYQDLIAKQTEITGECWVYKDKYTVAKKHQQISNRKRKAQETDTGDIEFDQLDPGNTEECNYYNKQLFPPKVKYQYINILFCPSFKLLFHLIARNVLLSGRFATSATVRLERKKSSKLLMMNLVTNMMRMV